MAQRCLNGIEIDYTVSGRGRPVILSHGYGATGRMWDGQRQTIGDRYRLITWDMRAAMARPKARSDAAQYSTDYHRGRHAGARSATRREPRGGRRALARRLHVAGVLPGASRDGRRADHLRLGAGLSQCRGSQRVEPARANERAGTLEARGLEALGGRSREVRDALGHHKSAQGLAHAARNARAARRARVIDGLASIRVPTLVIVGDQDTPFLAPCEYMAKKIPGARLEVITGAGHASNLDQPEAFDRVLLRFLDSLPA